MVNSLDLPSGMERVNGDLITKTGSTLKHASVQAAIGSGWRAYANHAAQGGGIYISPPCCTKFNQRCPDIAYVTAELYKKFGLPNIYPQAFPLIAEVASPDDVAEMLFEKAREYLESGSQEVWILLPETRLAFIVLPEQVLAFTEHQTIETQAVLKGFAIVLSDLSSNRSQLFVTNPKAIQ